MREMIDIDTVTYEIMSDEGATEYQGGSKLKYYIRSGKPFCYLTENMIYRDVQLLAKAMRQLGFTVIDRTQ